MSLRSLLPERHRLLLLPFLLMACSSSSAAATPMHTHDGTNSTLDLSTLLAEARGAPATVCALAARSVESLTWRSASSDAPSTPLHEAQQSLLRTANNVDTEEARGRLVFTAAEQRLLLNNVGDADHCVRELSVRLLGTARRTTATLDVSSGLMERLRSTDDDTRETAAFGLGLLAPTNATQALASALRDRSAAVRANAAWALGRVDDGLAVSGLLAIIGDPDDRVRLATVASLGQLDSTSAAAALIRVLERDQSASVRRMAAWALRELRTERALVPLAKALRSDSDAAVREMCAWALGNGRRRETTVAMSDALLDALRNDASASVRESAAWALGQIGDVRAANGLSAALDSDANTQVRGTSAWSLGQLDIKSAPSGLVKALSDSDDDVRFKASWALSEVRDAQTIAAIRVAYGKEQHAGARRAQLRLLLAFGDQSESLLKELLSSSDSEVREAAVRGLAGRTRMNPWPWPAPRPRPFP